jgi:hypothetical protein
MEQQEQYGILENIDIFMNNNKASGVSVECVVRKVRMERSLCQAQCV